MGPRPSGLGKLSAWYESGKRGTDAVGYDNRGKLSLGKYQIAFGVGTLKVFLVWCKSAYSLIYGALWPLYPTITGTLADKKGPFAKKWCEIEDFPQYKLAEAEHEFIAVTHYDAAFDKLTGGAQDRVRSWRALQDVLWSTAVQHGDGGAVEVFNRTFVKAASPDSWVDAIYAARGRRLGGLTKDVVASCLDRYRHERADARRMVDEQRRLGSPRDVDIKLAQHKLNLAGVSPALVEDGKFGPKTYAAIQWFQNKTKLPESCVFDQATWAALGEVK